MYGNFLDFSNFQRNWSSERTAIYDYDKKYEYTYTELDQRAENLANWLVNVQGLKKGDCIGFCARNCIAYFDAFFAAFKTGVILTTYNYMYRPNELTSLIQNEHPKIIFLDKNQEDRVKGFQDMDFIQTVVMLNGETSCAGVLNYDDVMHHTYAPITEAITLDMEDILMYIHTGGTTGMPKAAMLSYRCIFANIVSEGISFGLNYQDTTYLFLPLFHTGGWNVIGMPILFYGGKLIIKRDLEPQKILQIIEEEKVTIGVAVPTVYRMIADDPRFDSTDFSHVRWLLVGAAPVEENVVKRYAQRNIVLTNAFGMTEVGPNNIAPPVPNMTMEKIREKWNSVGLPMCFNTVKIVDDNDQIVEQGQVGELCFKGPMLFSGYLNNQEETDKTLRNGWVYTGDLAKQDEEGYIYIVGRKKNMIIVGGENVFPVEVEQYLARFPGVKEACVFGVPDYKWGESIKAIITLDSDTIDLDLLHEYIWKNLSGVKRPKKIIVVDQIPKSSVGKVDYRTVHALYDEA